MAESWDNYTEHLAVLGEWSPMGTVARDALAMAKENPGGPEVALQAIQLLRKTWATLPGDVRSQAMGVLQNLGDQIFESWGEMADSVDGNFIAQIVVAGIDGVMKVAEGVKGSNDVKRAASNFEHGNAQAVSMRQVIFNPHGGLYSVMYCYTYAQFIKIRWGGDYDRKPCFTRPGLERDRIFMGHASAPDGKGCATPIRRKIDEPFGPFAPAPCNRRLGVSAMLWPWWSAAYEAKPLARWQGSPAGADFQAGLSKDTNGLLIDHQANLITNARVNLEANMDALEYKVRNFLRFWDGHARVGQILRSSMRDGGKTKAVDPKRNPNHEPSEGAAAYWYYDDTGMIQPYDNQPDSSRDDWGVELPPGSSNAPARLAVSITQYNAVLSARAAFAQRRLATLRSPALVRGIITDVGINNLDGDAREAIEYARDSTDATLPYPGDVKLGTTGQLKPLPTRKHLPGRLPPLKKPAARVSPVAVGAGILAAAAAVGGALLVAKR